MHIYIYLFIYLISFLNNVKTKYSEMMIDVNDYIV